MQEFNLASSEKQDEILGNFPVDSGTDFSSYTQSFQYHKEYSHPSGSTNSIKITNNTEIVTGGGFITYLRLEFTPSQNTNITFNSKSYIKVMIDDAITINLSAGPKNYRNQYVKGSVIGSFGFSQDITNFDINNSLDINSSIVNQSLTIGLPTPLFFNKSIKVIVEIDGKSNTANNYSGMKFITQVEGVLG